MIKTMVIGVFVLMSVGGACAVPPSGFFSVTEYCGDISLSNDLENIITECYDVGTGSNQRYFFYTLDEEKIVPTLNPIRCTAAGWYSSGEGILRINVSSSLVDTITVYTADLSYTGLSYRHATYRYYCYYESNDTLFSSEIFFEQGVTSYSTTADDSYISDDGTTWTGHNITTPRTPFYVKTHLTAWSTSEHGGASILLTFGGIIFNKFMSDDEFSQPNTTFSLSDDCGNPLQNATTTIFTNNVEQIYQGTDNPITINEAGNYDRYDKFSVIIDTHDMAVEKTVYADDEFNTFNLYHNNVDWDLQTIVYDNDTKDELEGVKVSINQDCRINGYPTYTYGLTNAYGFVSSAQLSNQNFTVECEKSGYKDYSSLFVSNFDAQVSTYLVEIYLDDTSSEYDGNQTIPEAPCSTAWSNNSNVVIHEINSSEDARLHYMAGDCTTLLYLERWSDAADMWLMVGSSITLDPFETGYIQYTTANWTEGETTLYRGRLWALHCYCDDTSTLKVWDTSDNNQITFKNLTANVQFKNKLSGHQVDPEKAIIIYAYAASNNTSLCNIDLELYNESTKVENISLTFFDWYISSTFTTYKWYPTYEYADGYNYTVKMIGFNDALLDIDNVFANTSSGSQFDPKNTLTVTVKDHHGNPLTYSTVFIEGWGSQASGNSDTVTIVGLSDGDVQYKTTKSGYIASIWQTITFSGADESVECILVKDSLTIGKGLKMTDSKIKSFLIPGLYLLLILILVGGVTNANKR